MTTILVVTASFVMPSVSTMGRRGAMMTASGDVLRFLAENRRRAVGEGARRWVRYEIEGSSLLAGPEDAAADHTFELPEGFEFGDHENAERLPDLVEESATVEQRQATWSPEISFYSDGTAIDAEWLLKDDGGRKRTVAIREMTGRVRILMGAPE